MKYKVKCVSRDGIRSGVFGSREAADAQGLAWLTWHGGYIVVRPL